MKACTSLTVSSTIAQLCPTIAGKLQLRRKFKNNDNGRVIRWWFLIRGEEDVLTELQHAWDRVSTQTSWRLEDCLRYKNSPEKSSDAALTATSSLLIHSTPLPTTDQLTNQPTATTSADQPANTSTTLSEATFLEQPNH